MCTEIEVRRDGESHYCETIGDLRKVGLTVVIADGYPAQDTDEFCLCCVDAQATAERNGMIARRATDAEGWPFPEIVILPTAGSEGG